MASTIRETTNRHGDTPATAIAGVEIVTATGEVRRAFRVGGAGPIFADYAAASRYADNLRAKDQRTAVRLIEAKRAAAKVIAAATQRAAMARHGFASITAHLDGFEACEAVVGRREFGAGLGV